MNTGHVPAIDPKTATGQQAHEYMLDRQARIWPGVARRYAEPGLEVPGS